ncbi:hypothetical protein WB66_23935 [bacteria symbiont BFo1 of Frankliniella occidentalis]|jgi:hypothetical protein|uniref:CS1 type fimbrial major subunit n=1 Tax=Erwinia aphidicola TaxID=68334 RepID=UPI000789F878|nr:CS1 type fimbrial major subunit [Erwinia aphidicola]KYP82318.1 hypothetical protein WB66_23935 [bacteria symbiont BFo1 of Frankliniella occidentalis]KYP85838.1 hypothetical protein WB91_23155 [bacteria symbiont BFo1 of Frankliniella occidentalis]PIJ51396.1 hypothetical protein BOM23_22785 [Erwinia sp. OLMDLW33]CAH0304811.1 CFA/I fimbrial subunit B [Erwinia aphidicola]
MKINFTSLCVVGMIFTSAAHAYQADITVTSTIDPTAGITMSDGSALPKSIDMNYTPGKGLNSYSDQVKLWTNGDYDMKVRLANTPQLMDVSGINTIPLMVKLNNTELNTTDTTYNFSQLFPSGNIDQGSNSMPLLIKQANATQAFVAGNYSGMVSMVISQATTKDGK